MIRRTTYFLILTLVLFSLVTVRLSKGSESSTRTCEFVWGYSQPPQKWYIDLTCPRYSTPGSTIQISLSLFFGTNVRIDSPGGLFMEICTLLNNDTWHQINKTLVLPASYYNKDTSRSLNVNVTIPKDSKISSFLNVSLYTNWNKWLPYPTEIIDMSYNELNSAFLSSQSMLQALAVITITTIIVAIIVTAYMFTRLRKSAL